MARILKVKKEGKKLTVSFPADHPKADKIDEMLGRLSPGYVEYYIQHGTDPHCPECRNHKCPDFGQSGDDACSAFKIGSIW